MKVNLFLLEKTSKQELLLPLHVHQFEIQNNFFTIKIIPSDPISSINLFILHPLGLLVTTLVYLSNVEGLLLSDVKACRTNLFKLRLVTL